MIAKVGDIVRLTTKALQTAGGDARDAGKSAKVMGLVYPEQPPGQRGVRLSHNLCGTNWYSEEDLEEHYTLAVDKK